MHWHWKAALLVSPFLSLKAPFKVELAAARRCHRDIIWARQILPPAIATAARKDRIRANSITMQPGQPRKTAI